VADLGKIDAAFFERVIAPRLGAEREFVDVGPRAGVDFGVVQHGGRAVVTATDPLSILPALGAERAGRLALDIVLTDVAVSGIAPTHVAVALTPPPEFDEKVLAGACRGIDAAAADLGVAVVDAHVGRYPGGDGSWIGGATGVGVGDPDAVVRPDGARPGDALVVSTGPAAEVAGLFATLFGDRLGIDDPTLASARERVEDIPAVADAGAAHGAGGVRAMHDATEGGLAGALVEMAAGAGVRFDVERAAVPVADGVEAVCDAIDVDPWRVTSCGTLVMAADPDAAEGVVAALEDRETPATVVGDVSAGEGVYVDSDRLDPPDGDPSWAAFRRLSAE